MSDDVKALYQAAVLEHSKQPRNEGKLDGATHSARASNPLCGDRVTLHLRVTCEVVDAATFEVRGCAICKASASMLTEAVTGRGVADGQALGQALGAALAGDAEASLGAIEALRGVTAFPSRKRCATLPWETFEKALGSPVGD